MIDDRFSSVAFHLAGFNTPKSRELAKSLQTEIQQEIDRAVFPHILSIVELLNAMGHKLTAGRENGSGEFVFREPLEEGRGHRFLVGVDVVITVGYPQTFDSIPL